MAGEARLVRLHRAALGVLLGGLLLLLLAGGWFALRAATVVSSLTDAQAQVALARDAYAAQDLRAGAEHVRSAQQRLADARHAAASPVWRVAGTLPLVGDDIAAVAAVTTSAAGLVDALAPVAVTAGEVEPGTALRGLLLDESLSPQLGVAHERAVAARELAAELSDGGLTTPVQERVAAFGAAVEQVKGPLAAAQSYTALLPGLLGARSPQELLVVVQTPAEVRSLGGLAGLVLVVRADGGALQVVDSYSGSTVPPTEDPVLSTPELAEHYALLGDRAGRYMINATMVPDASLAGRLLAAFHERRSGSAPDAVVLIDVRLLSDLLAATGPVQLPDGRQVSADTSDDLLQYGVYDQIRDPAAQDVYFAAVAGAVFDALLDPATDQLRLARALVEGAERQRLALWSPDPAQQAHLQAVDLHGDLLADPDAVGVFLNDGTGAKLQYFLDARASTGQVAGGARTLTVELGSRVPEPSALPDHVAGGYERLGLPRGTQRVQVAVYGPVGGGPGEWRVDGAAVPVGSAVVEGRGAAVHSVDIAPGQQVRVEVDLPAAPAGAGDPQLVVTPSVSTG